MSWNAQILSGRSRQRHHPNDGPELDRLAATEGWYTPPLEVTRVRLRPWQQAVFWGLRFYIAVMLVIMVVGFVHIAGGQ